MFFLSEEVQLGSWGSGALPRLPASRPRRSEVSADLRLCPRTRAADNSLSDDWGRGRCLPLREGVLPQRASLLPDGHRRPHRLLWTPGPPAPSGPLPDCGEPPRRLGERGGGPDCDSEGTPMSQSSVTFCGQFRGGWCPYQLGKEVLAEREDMEKTSCSSPDRERSPVYYLLKSKFRT